ncbi:hypothetical protein P3S67_023020 [Capsicum chacoense]
MTLIRSNTSSRASLVDQPISRQNSICDANNKFVENLTVNTSFAAGMWCYITFIATDADDLNAPKTFQALAWWGIDGKREVEFRRLKKPSD